MFQLITSNQFRSANQFRVSALRITRKLVDYHCKPFRSGGRVVLDSSCSALCLATCRVRAPTSSSIQTVWTSATTFLHRWLSLRASSVQTMPHCAAYWTSSWIAPISLWLSARCRSSSGSRTSVLTSSPSASLHIQELLVRAIRYS